MDVTTDPGNAPSQAIGSVSSVTLSTTMPAVKVGLSLGKALNASFAKLFYADIYYRQAFNGAASNSVKSTFTDTWAARQYGGVRRKTRRIWTVKNTD